MPEWNIEEQGQSIWLCRGPAVAEIWPDFQHYD